MEAQADPEMLAALRDATLVVPDGMPVVWAANLLGERLRDRVYGPELMLRYNDRCARLGHRVWLYGGRDRGSLVQLALSMRRHHRHQGHRRLLAALPPAHRRGGGRHRLRDQRGPPDVLWVGIGVPKQEKWMARMRERLDVPVMCGVGAAFDSTPAGCRWLPLDAGQGLEWVYRTAPGAEAAAARYLYTNPRFVAGFARQYLAERRRRRA